MKFDAFLCDIVRWEGAGWGGGSLIRQLGLHGALERRGWKDLTDEETEARFARAHFFNLQPFTHRLQKEQPIQFMHAQNYCVATLLFLQMLLLEQNVSFSGTKWCVGTFSFLCCIGSRILEDISAGCHEHRRLHACQRVSICGGLPGPLRYNAGST